MNLKASPRKPQWSFAVAIMLAALILAGCCGRRPRHHFSTCPENVDYRFPIITCQPVDVAEKPGGTATFEIEAHGRNLTHQWFFCGNGDPEFKALDGMESSRLEIKPIAVTNYGLYMCVVGSTGGKYGPVAVESRWAALGSVGSTNGAGGPFAAVQNPVGNSSVAKVCNYTVSKKWVAFPGSQTPDPGIIGFEGYLKKVAGGVTSVIPNSDYVLQWWVNIANTSCATNLPAPSAKVGFSATPGLAYKFYAHFLPGKAPSSGTSIILDGAWMTP